MSFIVLLSVLMMGTLGFWLLTGKSSTLFDSFYMTVITITTIGFHEIIDTSPYPFARLFVVIIAFLGISTFTFILSNLTALIIEGELQEVFRKKRIKNKIKKMEDHYIICGVGRVGYHIMQELNRTNRKFVVVDCDSEKLRNLYNQITDLVYIHGNADIDDTLNKAGIKNAKGIFASTGDDNQNLVISLSAKHLNPDIKVVSRCLNAVNHDKIKKAGADIVITDNYIAGMRMASEMVRPTVTTFLDKMLTDKIKNLRVEEVEITDRCNNLTLKSIFSEKFSKTLVIAIEDGDDWIYNPRGDTILKNGYKIVVITDPDEREQLIKYL